DLILQPKEKIEVTGKYALMRLDYLKKNNKALYTTLLMKDQLMEHLLEIQEESELRVNELVLQMMEEEKITEELKQQNQMKWIGLMNNLKMTAEEIVTKELIYS